MRKAVMRGQGLYAYMLRVHEVLREVLTHRQCRRVAAISIYREYMGDMEMRNRELQFKWHIVSVWKERPGDGEQGHLHNNVNVPNATDHT